MSVPSHSTRLHLLPLLIALGAGGLCSLAQAQSLSDLYTAARGYDATYQAAKQQSDATLAKAAQAQALLLPTVGLSVSANQINQDTQAPVSRNYDYDSQSATLSATQPLYRPGNAAS